eukprot:g20081.t1
MVSPRVASSIAQVSRELVRVENLRGSVQTVFPIHTCMPPTANNSETQDYGTVGNDGPIEGAAKVFQITLRDLSVPGSTSTSNSLHHRINAYFYDQWADKHHAGIGPGDEIEVSGPAARLVHPDPSAADHGDHPFCLVFHTANDDALLALGAVAAKHLSGGGQRAVSSGGAQGGGRVEEDIVSCRVVRKAEQLGPRGGAGSRGGVAGAGGGGDGSGRGGRGGSRAGGRGGTPSYVYTNLNSLEVQEEKTNVYGIVCSFTHRHQSRGRDMTISVGLLDETCTESDNAVPCNFFSPSAKGLPAPAMVGDIVRLHRAKVQEYRGRPQLLAAGSTAWLVIRRKQDLRESFLKVPIGNAATSTATSPGGGVDDEDPDPDDDSPLSGPDAGGGEADAVLLSSEWEVQASSANYTMSQVDQDRCNALNAWLVNRSPYLWLKPSSEVKVWVKDIFRRPQTGPTVSEEEVDLVCCLTSKHEKTGGGAGSISDVYVADGTGFASSMPGGEWAGRRDAALLKGVRVALGKPGWSPRDPRPPPFPAQLKVEVVENKKEWEALALSPGMWVRLRRLTITKNRQTGTMSAKMKDKGSCVNPLHPRMAEVQHIGASYATRCASAGGAKSGRTQDRNAGSGSGRAKKPSVPPAPSHPPAVPIAAAAAAPPAEAAPSPRQSAASLGAPPSSKGGGSSTAPGSLAPGGAAANASVLRETGASGVAPTAAIVRVQGAVPRKAPTTQPAVLRSGQGVGSSGSQGAAPAASGGGVGGFVGANSRRVANGCEGVGVGAGAGGGEPARGTKRPRPVSEGSYAGAERGLRSAAPGGGPVCNLGVVRSTTAPQVFDTRARIVSHWPPKVTDFVRKGPAWADGPRYLFTLKLEDDYGVVEAVAAGPEAARLLPGCPSPAEFLASPDVRARVKRVLAGLESTGVDGAERCLVDLRLRSYLAPLVGTGQREGMCKRYSIIAPSCLDAGRRVQGEG